MLETNFAPDNTFLTFDTNIVGEAVATLGTLNTIGLGDGIETVFTGTLSEVPISDIIDIKIEGISMCGKTGTVENNKGKDHSTFIAFAPRDTPKIAIAVYVENGGFGSTYAGPISSLMIEKYINGKIEGARRKSLEKFILNANLTGTKEPTNPTDE